MVYYMHDKWNGRVVCPQQTDLAYYCMRSRRVPVSGRLSVFNDAAPLAYQTQLARLLEMRFEDTERLVFPFPAITYRVQTNMCSAGSLTEGAYAPNREGTKNREAGGDHEPPPAGRLSVLQEEGRLAFEHRPERRLDRFVDTFNIEDEKALVG